jgi:hypothetical protein
VDWSDCGLHNFLDLFLDHKCLSTLMDVMTNVTNKYQIHLTMAFFLFLQILSILFVVVVLDWICGGCCDLNPTIE